MASALEKYLMKEGKSVPKSEEPHKGKKKDKSKEVTKGEKKVDSKKVDRDCGEEVYEDKKKRPYMD